MKNEDKVKVYRELLDQCLELNSKILRDCYWRPTVSPETLAEIENLVAAIHEQLNTGSV